MEMDAKKAAKALIPKKTSAYFLFVADKRSAHIGTRRHPGSQCIAALRG